MTTSPIGRLATSHLSEWPRDSYLALRGLSAGRAPLGCGVRGVRKLAALAGGRADRGGGDDPEEHEGGGAEEPEVESEGERLAEGVVACAEVVGPAGRDGGQDGEAERSADLLGCVE